ncbi:hypothetical protein ACFQ0M_18995 [Kitasatospora aburaviensis]
MPGRIGGDHRRIDGGEVLVRSGSLGGGGGAGNAGTAGPGGRPRPIGTAVDGRWGRRAVRPGGRWRGPPRGGTGTAGRRRRLRTLAVPGGPRLRRARLHGHGVEQPRGDRERVRDGGGLTGQRQAARPDPALEDVADPRPAGGTGLPVGRRRAPAAARAVGGLTPVAGALAGAVLPVLRGGPLG